MADEQYDRCKCLWLFKSYMVAKNIENTEDTIWNIKVKSQISKLGITIVANFQLDDNTAFPVNDNFPPFFKQVIKSCATANKSKKRTETKEEILQQSL